MRIDFRGCKLVSSFFFQVIIAGFLLREFESLGYRQTVCETDIGDGSIIMVSYRFCVSGEVSGETVSAGTVPRGGDRVEAADLGRHNNITERSDGATLAANTAIDARGGSPQGAHLSGAATPRPPRSRRRPNQNGLDTTQVR